MKFYVQDSHANKQINIIASFVEDGVSDAEIVGLLGVKGYRNLLRSDGVWAEADVLAIREKFRLNFVDVVSPVKKNKISRISLMGGILGAIFTNPRKALEDEVTLGNKTGWVATHIEPHRTTNLFVFLVQIAVLIFTFGLFTWGGGYLVLFEREDG
jgi:hypothetical protein